MEVTTLTSSMNDIFPPKVETFSAGYDIIHDTEIIEYGKNLAIMDFELFDLLKRTFGEDFIVRIENIHYRFKRDCSLPRNAVAVPEDNHDDPDALLVKNESV